MLSYLFICRFGNREDVKRVYSPSIGCSETFFFSKLMLYKFPHQRKEVIPEILKLLQILKSSKLFSLYRKKKLTLHLRIWELRSSLTALLIKKSEEGKPPWPEEKTELRTRTKNRKQCQWSPSSWWSLVTSSEHSCAQREARKAPDCCHKLIDLQMSASDFQWVWHPL